MSVRVVGVRACVCVCVYLCEFLLRNGRLMSLVRISPQNLRLFNADAHHIQLPDRLVDYEPNLS